MSRAPQLRLSEQSHKCFGCGKQIADHEPHIHVGMDEWAAKNGLPTLVMDDLMTLAICEPCTQQADDGWQLEAHEVDESRHA